MSRPIMIVDDDLSSFTLTERILNRAGIRNPIFHFAYAAKAILYLEHRQNLPIVILLDLALPDIHGIDALRYIRNHAEPEIKDICVFILTVSDDQETMVKSIEHGASAFLRKNLELAAFMAAAQSCGINLEIE